MTPLAAAAAAQEGPGGSTPLSKRPATLDASSGARPGPPHQAPGNAELTNMAVAMEARMRAIEQWITASAIPALDDHASKLDTVKAGQAHLGGLTCEGLEFAEVLQKVSESADKINHTNLQVGLMQ